MFVCDTRGNVVERSRQMQRKNKRYRSIVSLVREKYSTVHPRAVGEQVCHSDTQPCHSES